jgi:hypothetical protein
MEEKLPAISEMFRFKILFLLKKEDSLFHSDIFGFAAVSEVVVLVEEEEKNLGCLLGIDGVREVTAVILVELT